MHLAVSCLLFLTCIPGMMSQDMAPDTILNLKDVTIYSSRIDRFAKGQAILTPDSLTRMEYPAGSLAELIGGFTSTYIRNYGQGTLTTLSFRGTSANHAGLLWNGIRISQPNIGYVDLSLVQGSFFKDVSVLYGGASPMFGSGSIGGGIHLESKPVFEKSGADFGLAASAGSFKSAMLEGNETVYRNNIYSRTAFSVVNAVNDFSYKDLQGEKEHLSHASIFKGGFIQDVAFRLPGNQYIMASAWFQYAERNIPPTLTEEKSEAVQVDRYWRTMVTWKDYNERNSLEAKLAYFKEYTLYDDPLSLIYSTIKSQSVVGSFESTWEVFKHSAVFAGAQLTYEYADLDYYEIPQDQGTMALYASYRQSLPWLKWQFSLNGRQEFLSGYRSPFLFSAGAEGAIWRFISGRFNVSRNFRAPTFNERCWQPGGNPDLRPEESWNEEAAVVLEKQLLSANLKLSITAYNSSVKNWILWLPGSGNIWSVENAQQVWSRGIELSGNQLFNINAVSLFFVESYSFTKSTNEKKLFNLDASYRKQLIYTPLHRLVIKAGTVFSGFNLTIRGNYTGEVFSSKDNATALPPYFLIDVVLSKSFIIKNEYPITIQFNLNNILNHDYQAIPYRPMPGTHFQVTVRAEINH